MPKKLHNSKSRSKELRTEKIHPTLSEIDIRVDGQAHVGRMGNHFNINSRLFHCACDGVNPSSCFRDMGSAKSGQSSATGFDKFLTICVKLHVAQLQTETTPWNFEWRKSIKRFQICTLAHIWVILWANAHGVAQLQVKTIR